MAEADDWVTPTDSHPDDWTAAPDAPAKTNPMGGGLLPATTEARQWGKDISTIGPDQRSSALGTPIDKAGATYGDTLNQYYDEAEAKMREGLKAIVAPAPKTEENEGMVGRLKNAVGSPMRSAAALAKIASGLTSGIVAPVTAAINPSLEYYTGMPGEKIADALTAGRSIEGVAGMRSMARLPAEASRARVPVTVDPNNPLSQVGTRRPPTEPAAPPVAAPIDTDRLSRELGAGDIPGPTAIQSEPMGVPRQGLDPNVRLLPAEVPNAPVAPAMRDSVGAARAESILDQMSPQTVDRWVTQFREHGITPAMIEARSKEMSPHEMFMNFNQDFEGHAGGIHATPGQGRVEIGQGVRQVPREQPERLQRAFDDSFGPDVNRTEWQQHMERAAQEESAPFWQRFDQMVVQPTPAIEAVLERPDMQVALRKANRTLQNRGQPIEHGFNVPEEGGGNSPQRAGGEGEQQVQRVPTARAFQLAKEALDDRIGAAVRSGERGDVRTFTKLKADLDAAVAAHPNAEIAQVWRQARNTYRGPMQLIDARRLGEDLIRGGGTTHWTEVPGILEGMNEGQREAVRIGLRNALSDLANRPGPQGLKQINAGLAGGNREIIRAVIGDDAAERLFHSLEAEHRMHHAPNRIIGNSVTAERQAYRDTWNTKDAGNPLSALAEVPGAVMHPLKTAGKKLLEATVARRQAARAAAERTMRDESARLLTLQGPERDAVAMELARRAHPEAAAPAPPTNPMGRAMGGRVLPHYVDQNPTDAQKAAGNYRKAHINVLGLDIAIENARGHWRMGADKDGKPWKVQMPAHYGYLKGTTGRDKDHLDVYVGPHTKCRRVWIIDQRNHDTGAFDEHKIFVGFAKESQVVRTYEAAFSDGKGAKRIQGIKGMDIDDLKAWLKSGNTTKPIAKAA